MVTAVWNDVVNNRRTGNVALSQAMHAQRVADQVAGAGLLPLAAVATLGGAGARLMALRCRRGGGGGLQGYGRSGAAARVMAWRAEGHGAGRAI